MTDRIRTTEELLDLLRESAGSNGYFEIGPDETSALWAHIEKQRELLQKWLDRDDGDPVGQLSNDTWEVLSASRRGGEHG